MSTIVEEPAGQQAIGGPGYERTLDLQITGQPPDSAKLKLAGGAIDWTGPQLQREARHTLLVDVVITAVEIRDKLDDDGYREQTTLTHTAQIESIRLADA